jgi:hypothetical protein
MATPKQPARKTSPATAPRPRRVPAPATRPAGPRQVPKVPVKAPVKR